MRTLRDLVAEAAACGRQFLADDEGATAIEYSLIVSGIAVAIIVTVNSVGISIKEVLYDKISSSFAEIVK